MLRPLLLPLMLLAATVAVPAPVLAQKPPGQAGPVSPYPQSIQDHYIAAYEAGNAGDLVGAIGHFDALIADPAFKDTPPEFQLTMYRLVAITAVEAELWDRSLTELRRVTQSDGATANDWWLLSSVARKAERPVEAVDAFLRVLSLYPQILTEAPEGWINRLLLSSNNYPVAQGRLIEALSAAGWEDPSGWHWMTHATRLLEDGKEDAALGYVRRIEGSSARMAMTVDRRFDGLRARHPDLFDVEAASVIELEEAEAQTRADGADLFDWLSYISLLRKQGRHDEAMALIDARIAEAEAPRKPGEAAVDPDAFIWALDTRSRLRIDGGDVEGGLADLRRAARRPEGGDINVSHAINLGNLYVRMDRPRDALDALTDVTNDRLAPYGRVQAAHVRACAYAALGDRTALKAELDFISANAAIVPASTWQVHACTGDEDAAAAALIVLLEDPRHRVRTLIEIQDFIERDDPTPGAVRWRAFRRSVLARPDVVAAIDAVGRRMAWERVDTGF